MPSGSHPNSKANLAKGTPFNAEVARKAGQKGAIASAEVRREKRHLREIVNDLLERPAVKKGGVPLLSPDGEPLTNSAAIVVAMLRKALSGDVKAAEKIMEWSGEAENKPLVENTIIIESSFGDE